MKKYDVVFRRYRKLPDGRILDARDYGYRAWPIPIAEYAETTDETVVTEPVK